MADNVQAIFEGKDAEEFLKGIKKRFGSAAQGSREMGGIISATVFQDIIRHFNNQEGPDGAWTAWSDVYEEHMQRIGKSGNRILQDTGRLRQGVKPGNYRAVSGGVLFFNEAKTKTGFPYAGAHDVGGPKLPQRKFMWLSNAAMESISQQVLRWVKDGA